MCFFVWKCKRKKLLLGPCLASMASLQSFLPFKLNVLGSFLKFRSLRKKTQDMISHKLMRVIWCNFSVVTEDNLLALRKKEFQDFYGSLDSYRCSMISHRGSLKQKMRNVVFYAKKMIKLPLIQR